MATHMPEMPPPMITTAALPWFLFPMGISGHGSEPVSSNPDMLIIRWSFVYKREDETPQVAGKEVTQEIQSSK